MFHGGTSFGYKAGSNLGAVFQACPTSYDYDAPLSEAGDPTDKYFAIRDVVGKYLPLPDIPLPKPNAKLNLGTVQLGLYKTFQEIMEDSNQVTNSTYPLSFEALSQPNAYVLYSTVINVRPSDPSLLTVPLRDRAYVYVDGVSFKLT